MAITPKTPAARSPSATNPPSGARRRMASMPATAMPQTTAISRKPTRMFTGDSLACVAAVRHHLMRVKRLGSSTRTPRIG